MSEIVVPVGDVRLDDRGLKIAGSMANRLGVPLRQVHVDIDVDHPAASYNDEATGIVASLEQDSLVVMATSRAGDPSNPSSIAEAVVRLWAGPVMLVGPEVRVPEWNDSVVVPLDGSPAAERAIPVGARLSDLLDVPLWVIQVVDPKTSKRVLELRADGESVSESAYLRGAAASASASRTVGWEIIHGDDPARGVLHFAHDHAASLIVATTRGASGIERIVFGSVCMEVVRAGTHPVVVIGPAEGREVELA